MDIPPSKYRTMQEELMNYRCKDGKAYMQLTNTCELREPIYLKRMEELFGVTAERVMPKKTFEPAPTESTDINNPYIKLKGKERHIMIIVFNGEKPVFATCPHCKSRFNIKRESP